MLDPSQVGFSNKEFYDKTSSYKALQKWTFFRILKGRKFKTFSMLLFN